MTRDEIIEMAIKAGFTSGEIAWHDNMFEAFAKLVAAKEREACAIACETNGRDLAGLHYAGVIRARGEAL